jgi:hypothetical protein
MYAWQGIWAAIVGIAALLLIAACCCRLHPALKGPRATPSNSSLAVYHVQPVRYQQGTLNRVAGRIMVAETALRPIELAR